MMLKSAVVGKIVGAKRLLSAFADGFTHWLDRFWACFGDQYDGATFVAECPTDLIGEILFVLLGKEFLTIDKQEECWGRQPGLCGVKELQAVAMRADRLTSFDGILEHSVQDRSGDSLLELCGDITDGFEQAVQMKAGFG